jgi:ribosomal protein L11 methyltransferase
LDQAQESRRLPLSNSARLALAIDSDEWAFENARENVKNNRVTRSVKVIKGDLQRARTRKVDLVVANVDMPTISKTMTTLLKDLKPDGIIILSGLLASDLPHFMDFLSQRGVVPLEIIEENEWVAVALTNDYAADRN